MNNSLKLPYTITFKNSLEELTAYHLLLSSRKIRASAEIYYFDWLSFIIIFGYAVYVSFDAYVSSPVFLLILFLGIWKIRTFRIYHRYFKKQVFLENKQRDTGHSTKITFDESGMMEEHAGIRSFAPWSCVKEPQILENILVIPLTSGQAALISGNSLNEGAPTLEQIRQLVETQRAAVTPL